jgi:hypothetical protein
LQDTDPDYDPAADTDMSTETESTVSTVSEPAVAGEPMPVPVAAEPVAAEALAAVPELLTASFNGTREQACNMINNFSIYWMQNPEEATAHLLRCLPFFSNAGGVERISVPYVAAMKLLHIISLKYNIDLCELVSFFIKIDLMSCRNVSNTGKRCTRCSTATSFYCGTHMKGKNEFDPVYYQSMVEEIARL